MMLKFFPLCCMLVAIHVAITNLASAQNVIRDAIDNNQPSAKATKLAEEKLRKLVGRFRLLRGKVAQQHLEHFLSNKGTDIPYADGSEIAKLFREDEGSQFTHQAAHEHAMKRIRAFFESQISSGQTTFPGDIPLATIGFTLTGPDRLQGPNVYASGNVFGVPVFPPSRVSLAAGFGDMQGPHFGTIRNCLVSEEKLTDGSTKFSYSFEIEYVWNDKYTFNNDANMSEWDEAAHYLEFIAQRAAAFKTSVTLKENVSESFLVLPDGSIVGSGGATPGGGGNNPQNDPGNREGDDNPSSPSGGQPSTMPGSTPSTANGSTTQLPPIVIEHPPGWGVGK